MRFKPNVWGPHYWFVFHSIAVSFPDTPNDVLKKKYYRFFQDFPVFIPEAKSSKLLADLIDEFPVSPYLDTKMNLMKWTHFIHNQVNKALGKPTLSFYDALELYYENYKPPELKHKETRLYKERMIWLLIVCGLVGFGVYMGQRT